MREVHVTISCIQENRRGANNLYLEVKKRDFGLETGVIQLHQKVIRTPGLCFRFYLSELIDSRARKETKKRRKKKA